MRSFPVVMLMVAALATPAMADHLVEPETSHARLAEASAQREHDLAAVDRLLASAPAAAAVSSAGLDVQKARAAVATLGDAELHELAARAAALEADPTAGGSSERDILIIVLVVLIVLLVLKAV